MGLFGKKKLNLYVVSMGDKADYDQYDSFVCAASSEKDALRTHPNSNVRWKDGNWVYANSSTPYKGYDWISVNLIHSDLTVTKIGESSTAVEGVILASYNAG